MKKLFTGWFFLTGIVLYCAGQRYSHFESKITSNIELLLRLVIIALASIPLVSGIFAKSAKAFTVLSTNSILITGALCTLFWVIYMNLKMDAPLPTLMYYACTAYLIMGIMWFLARIQT